MARPGLDKHPKFGKLARSLGSELLAVGALHFLWETAYEAGDDYIGDSADVEWAAHWTQAGGEPGKLTKALADAGGDGRAGFIEPAPDQPEHFRIHDLYDHAPEYVAGRRRRETERKREKSCEQCGTVYHSPDSRSKYCSDNCRKAKWKQDNSGPATDGDGPERSGPSPETDRNGSATDNEPSPAPAPAPLIKNIAAKAATTSTKPKKRDPLFDAVAQVAYADPDVNGAQIGKVCKALRQAKPPYTPEEVLALPEAWKAAGYNADLSLHSIPTHIGRVRKQPTANRVGQKQLEETQRKLEEDKAAESPPDAIAAAFRRSRNGVNAS